MRKQTPRLLPGEVVISREAMSKMPWRASLANLAVLSDAESIIRESEARHGTD